MKKMLLHFISWVSKPLRYYRCKRLISKVNTPEDLINHMNDFAKCFVVFRGRLKKGPDFTITVINSLCDCAHFDRFKHWTETNSSFYILMKKLVAIVNDRPKEGKRIAKLSTFDKLYIRYLAKKKTYTNEYGHTVKLTQRELASWFGVCHKTIYKIIKKG